MYIVCHSTWFFRRGLTFTSAFSPWKRKGKQDPPKKHHMLAALAWSEKQCEVWGFFCCCGFFSPQEFVVDAVCFLVNKIPSQE